MGTSSTSTPRSTGPRRVLCCFAIFVAHVLNHRHRKPFLPRLALTLPRKTQPNTTQHNPQQAVGTFYLDAFLAQLRESGFSVFVVRGVR